MKTVLITGASAGFGEAAARLLDKQGEYQLILVARRKEKLELLAKELDSPTLVCVADVTDRKQVEKLFKDLPQKFSEIDVLVNNAGLALGAEPAPNINIEDWETMVDTNIKGLLYFTHEALKTMLKRNKGMIINIGSVAGIAPYPGGNVYGSTKAFVNQFTRNLRADLFGTDIRVTDIKPGAAETEFSEVRFKGDKDKAKKVYEGTRALKAQDIAETILWVMQRPINVNIDSIEVMPIDQTYAGLKMYRE